MSDLAISTAGLPPTGADPHRPNIHGRVPLVGVIGFLVVLAGGIGYALYKLSTDVSDAGGQPLATGAFLLLGLALLIALGFEFVNGFHDTANAVATVIYTHSLPPQVAVIWSGCWNLAGVVYSSGLVAFTIVSLLPVELILQVGTGAGYAMIFALLIAAIIWNLGTWSFGLPASSSHTLIGSIIGVGLANQLLSTQTGTSGVDWGQVWGVFKALILSPIVGFGGAYLLLLLLKKLLPDRRLYTAPDTSHPPPTWIRGLLVLTCTGVSFFHGSNDGQKGMGLIMLILIGALPTAYALNRAMPENETSAFIASMNKAHDVFAAHSGGAAQPDETAARDQLRDAIGGRKFEDKGVYASAATLAASIAKQVQDYGAIKKVPAAAVQNVRNDMYLSSEAVRLMQKGGDLKAAGLSDDEQKTLGDFKKSLDAGTKFIPFWVKLSVAIALGLGTMVGWKRIVVTVGEKIGKAHLTYGQGASAELVAMATIGAADVYGLPVSTTHVLSSGIAGTMAANGSGIQWSTVRNIALAWVLTLPVAMVLSGVLFAILRQVF